MLKSTAFNLDTNGIEDVSEKNYQELYQRNWPIISARSQEQIKNLRVAVAGCGSTGGAFIDGAIRLGIKDFKLTDNGSYELNNLNRQMVNITDLGLNKATAYSRKLRQINRFCEVKFYPGGFSKDIAKDFLSDVDVIFDAIDVTNEAGMKMKLFLHEYCAANSSGVVLSALDLGYTQWIKSYDYRKNILALDGKLESTRSIENPLKAILHGFCDSEDLPVEIVEELLRLLKAPAATSACQLGSACFLLSALVTPHLLHFVEKGYFPKLLKIDLLSYFLDDHEKVARESKRDYLLKELKECLNTME